MIALVHQVKSPLFLHLLLPFQHNAGKHRVLSFFPLTARLHKASLSCPPQVLSTCKPQLENLHSDILNITILGLQLGHAITELHLIYHLLNAVLNQGQGIRPMYQGVCFQSNSGHTVCFAQVSRSPWNCQSLRSHLHLYTNELGVILSYYEPFRFCVLKIKIIPNWETHLIDTKRTKQKRCQQKDGEIKLCGAKGGSGNRGNRESYLEAKKKKKG